MEKGRSAPRKPDTDEIRGISESHLVHGVSGGRRWRIWVGITVLKSRPTTATGGEVGILVSRFLGAVAPRIRFCP